GVVPPLGEGGAIPLRREAERLLSPAFARQTEAMWARDRDLLRALAASARFGEMPLWGYVNDVDADEQKQFSALCALPGDGTGFAAFRGTDNTLVG
ncbi:Mbeg1-like protein, partial [Bittarella massiliensis (ex Durand et al. 2017)]